MMFSEEEDTFNNPGCLREIPHNEARKKSIGVDVYKVVVDRS